jgi:hypothetical protein
MIMYASVLSIANLHVFAFNRSCRKLEKQSASKVQFLQ